MIYTVTLNPSLDLFMTVDGMERGRTNRSRSEEYKPGGKGINVSIVLKQMGIDSVALGFLAGFTGKEIAERLEKQGIATEFEMLSEGESRINVKIKNINGTEINGAGPVISPEVVQKLKRRLDKLGNGDYLVLCGSIPGSMDKKLYRELMEQLTGRGVQVIVDANGEALRSVLPLHPFLVKPNQHELGELFGVELSTREQVIPYAKKLCELGAQNVIVSLGALGAVFVDQSGVVYETQAPEGILKNAVGAGDSMIAGFLTELALGGAKEKAFLRCVATGSATAFSEDFATRELVEELLSDDHMAWRENFRRDSNRTDLRV